MDKTKVILNHMPPENTVVVSPISAILKNYLNQHKMNSVIIYWNLKLAALQSNFIWSDNLEGISSEDESCLLLFFNYLAIKGKSEKAYIHVKAKLMSLKPNYVTSEVSFFDKHMNLYARKLDEIIDEYIEEIYSTEILCFMFFIDNKYKWICTSIIAEKIKLKYSESIIVIGGIEYKDTAVDYLQHFKQFDFSIWGEVEKTTFDLCNYLAEKNETYQSLSNLVFRSGDTILTSSSKKENYASHVEQALRPDYSDFIKQLGTISMVSTNNTPVIGIETNRKHWNKSVKAIADEISYFVNEHQMYAFHFPSYKLIGNKQTLFGRLLDALILIKEQHPEFSVSLVPVVAKTISPAILHKMMFAGFYSIRIDYISASESLLKKYETRSTFADNLLLIKFAFLYHIILIETDIIMGIPGETDEDILQAISNLYYLRFFFKGGLLRYRMRKVEVMRHDKCYKRIKRDKHNWRIDNSLTRFLPINNLKSDDENASIIGLSPIQVSSLWNDFKQSESYFIQNRFEYKLYRKSVHAVLYKELFNNNVIHEFELDAIDWFILQKANSQVTNIKFLLEEIKDKMKKDFMEIEIINTLENLKFERLIYISDDYTEIVSIINTDLIL